MFLQGKEPTWAEAKSQLGERQQQDDGMNKGRKLKERCRETEPFGPGREKIGSCGKETEKMGALNYPRNEQ